MFIYHFRFVISTSMTAIPKQNHSNYELPKTFSSGRSLKINVHEGHKDYNCESCSKSFTRAGSLKKHIHTVHNGQKDHKCESCGKAFSHTFVLNFEETHS